MPGGICYLSNAHQKVVCWLFMDPNREANPNLSPLAVKVRMVLMLVALVVLAGGSLVYKTMFLD